MEGAGACLMILRKFWSIKGDMQGQACSDLGLG